MTLVVFCCIVSYLLGALPFGVWIGQWWKGIDIRTLGSQNIGATNVYRVLGPGPGITVFLLDTVKGLAIPVGALLLWPALAAFHTNVPDLTMPYRIAIGLCAIFGHTFSPFLRFKGGKAVATSGGVLLALNPWVALIALLAFVLVVAVTRYVSLGSMIAALTLPFTSVFVLSGTDRLWMLGLSMVLAVLVTVRHRANIQRLLNHTEAKIGQRTAMNDDATDAAEVN